MNHDELALDLAGHLRGSDRMVWTNIQLGPSPSPRPDVYTINKSFKSPNPAAYEVKVSRSDFLSDVSQAKWTKYLNYAHSVVFACESGLIKKDEVPAVCGLMYRHENAWRYAKRPTPNPSRIVEECWIKLLIDGVEREGPRYRAKHWNWDGFSKKFGSEAARYVADAAETHRRIEQAEYDAENIRARAVRDAEQTRKNAIEQCDLRWKELLSILGLDATDDHYRVRSAVEDIRRRTAGSIDRRVADNLLRDARSMVRTLEAAIPEANDET